MFKEKELLCSLCRSKVSVENSRPHHNNQRICMKCRTESLRKKCCVQDCQTPVRKALLVSTPQKLCQLNYTQKDVVYTTFGFTAPNAKCCKPCYKKIENHILDVQAYSEETTIIQKEDCRNQKGRPRVSFENASKRTKARIKQQADQLMSETVHSIFNLAPSTSELLDGAASKHFTNRCDQVRKHYFIAITLLLLHKIKIFNYTFLICQSI